MDGSRSSGAAPQALLERPAAAPPTGSAPPPGGSLRAAWQPAWLAAWVLVAVVTLVPVGQGWSWGSPAAELRWYVTGFGSASTMLQLVGNLALLAAPAALAVVRRPALGGALRLAGAGLLAGGTIEFLQWVLPLGRVVSPLDAVLNATGVVVTGLFVAHRRVVRRARPSRPGRERPGVPGRPG
jgi:hypothetical protein